MLSNNLAKLCSGCRSEKIRKFIAVFIFMLLPFLVLPIQAVYPDKKGAELQATEDLKSLLLESRSKKLPVLLMFSEMGCPYCGVIEEDFLNPMILSGQYEDKVIIRKITYSNYKTIKDLKGNPVKITKITDKYNISFYPTIIFLDSKGSEIAERIVGLSTPDYFGYVLDEAILKAVKAFH